MITIQYNKIQKAFSAPHDSLHGCLTDRTLQQNNTTD